MSYSTDGGRNEAARLRKVCYASRVVPIRATVTELWAPGPPTTAYAVTSHAQPVMAWLMCSMHVHRMLTLLRGDGTDCARLIVRPCLVARAHV